MSASQEDLLQCQREIYDDLAAQGEALRSGHTELKGYFTEVLNLLQPNSGQARSAVDATVSAMVGHQVQLPRVVVGLEDKIESIKGILAKEGVTALGLVGMGGIGKEEWCERKNR